MEPATIQYQVCHPGTSVQNGKEPDRQGYKCKSGDCSFVIGDSAINPSVELKRYTGVLFYSLGKTSFHFLAQLFDLSAATIYQWIGLTAETVGTPVVAAGIEEIEIDRRWHFLGTKKQKMDPPGAESSHRENYQLGFSSGDAVRMKRLDCKLEQLSECLF